MARTQHRVRAALTATAALLVVAASATAIAGVGPEVILSPRERSLPTEYPTAASVAAGSDVRLVAWQQQRWDLNENDNWDVLCCRIDSNGSVLDPLGIELATGAENQVKPTVSSDGTSFLITWNEQSTFAVRARRVASDGAILDSAPLQLGVGERVGQGYDGVSYRVLIRSPANQLNDVHVSASGVVSTPSAPIPLASASLVGSIGPTSLVVHSDGTKVWGVRLDKLGVSLDPLPGLVIDDPAPHVWRVVAAPLNGGHVVGWQAADNKPEGGVTQASSAIAIVSDTFQVYSRALGGEQSESLEAVARGSEAAILWDGVGSARAARIAADGSLLQSPSWVTDLPTVFDSFFPALAGDGSGYSVVTPRAYPQLASFFHLTPALVRDSPDVLPFGAASDQRHVAVSAGGNGYLVAWTDTQNTDVCPNSPGADVYAVRLDACGQVLDSSPLAVSSLVTHGAGTIRAAFGGGTHLVVWQDLGTVGTNATLRAARVLPSGQVLDPNGIQVSPYSEFALASDGNAFLVAWTGVFGGGEIGHIVGRMIGASGGLDPTTIDISGSSASNFGRPEVAFDGSSYVVSWDDLQGGGIYAARVAPSGVVLDASQQLASGSDLYNGPIASDGSNTLVTWVYVTPGGPVEWRGRLFGKDGKPVNSATWQLSTSPWWDPVWASLTFSENTYVWQSFENETFGANGRARLTPALRRFSPDGTLLDATPLTLPEYESESPKASAASVGAGVLVATTPWLRHPDNAHRARARLVTWGSAPQCDAGAGAPLAADFSAPDPTVNCGSGSGGVGLDGGADAAVGGAGVGGIGGVGASANVGGHGGVGGPAGPVGGSAHSSPAPELRPTGGCAFCTPAYSGRAVDAACIAAALLALCRRRALWVTRRASRAARAAGPFRT